MPTPLAPERPFPTPDFPYVSKLALPRFIQTNLGNFQEVLQPLQNTEHEYAIRRGVDALPFIQRVAAKDTEVSHQVASLKTVVLLEVDSTTANEQHEIHDRTIVLLEDIDGRQAAVTIALHGKAQGIAPRSYELFNPLIHGGYFGGMGRYSPDREHTAEPALLFALAHAEGLATVMDAKAKACNFTHLAGSKAVITDMKALPSDQTNEVWLANPAMQYATGILFSKAGPEPLRSIITGSDAGQTQETIDRLGYGSRLADETSYNIVGTSLYGFTGTAGFVEHSMRGSYDRLQQLMPDYLPALPFVTAAVQGLGKIGSTALAMYLNAGCTVYVADTLLDLPEEEMSSEMIKRRREMERMLASLEAQYPKKIISTSSQDIWDQRADVISPCSNQEGIIDETIVNRLATAGTVKLVLSGANNPLKVHTVAEYAYQQYGILILPEVISNNGSAIAAGLEPTLLYEMSKGIYTDITTCINNILVPYIRKSASMNIDTLVETYTLQNQGKPRDRWISLYKVGDVIFG